MRFHLLCRVRHLLGGLDTQPTNQADERIEADNALEAFIKWLASPDAWIRADGADQLKIRKIGEARGKGLAPDFESVTTGTDWEFGGENLDINDEELDLAGTSCMGEFEFEITVKQYKDGAELEGGLFVRDPGSLKYDALVEIARYCQGGLFLDQVDGRDTWTLDKDIAGSDFIDHIYQILSKHGLVPEEVNEHK